MKKMFLALGVCLLVSGCASLDDSVTAKRQKLFNGRDLKGWNGDPTLWSVQNGVIHGETKASNPLKQNSFLIWTNGVVENFELRFSYRILPQNDKNSANSGAQYRSTVDDPTKWVVGGYQADFEAGTTYSGILYEERRSRGIMALRGEKVVWGSDGKKQVVGKTEMTSEQLQQSIRKNEWNEYLVIAQGNHFIHKINGHTTVDVTDADPSKMAKSGVLAFQIHTGPPMVVEFKDVELTRLDP